MVAPAETEKWQHRLHRRIPGREERNDVLAVPNTLRCKHHGYTRKTVTGKVTNAIFLLFQQGRDSDT